MKLPGLQGLDIASGKYRREAASRGGNLVCHFSHRHTNRALLGRWIGLAQNWGIKSRARFCITSCHTDLPPPWLSGPTRSCFYDSAYCTANASAYQSLDPFKLQKCRLSVLESPAILKSGLVHHSTSGTQDRQPGSR